jgi:hypothetical protein
MSDFKISNYDNMYVYYNIITHLVFVSYFSLISNKFILFFISLEYREAINGVLRKLFVYCFRRCCCFSTQSSSSPSSASNNNVVAIRRATIGGTRILNAAKSPREENVVDAVNRDQQQSPNLRTHHHHIVQMK